MKKFIQEFKDFAIKGNMFDMAIGMIIGSAFTGLVKAFVDNLVNPFIAVFTGGSMDFTAYVWVVNNVEIKYGAFISGLINFLITAIVIFLMVKFVNKLRNINEKKEEPVVEEAPKEPEISSTDKLLMEILEELKNKA